MCVVGVTNFQASSLAHNQPLMLFLQCNRQLPCNHCTRRRRTEQCTYSSGPPSQSQSRLQEPQIGDYTQADKMAPSQQIDTDQTTEMEMSWMGLNRVSIEPKFQWRHTGSLSENFGYFEYSDSNTLGLLRRVGAQTQSNISSSPLFLQ